MEMIGVSKWAFTVIASLCSGTGRLLRTLVSFFNQGSLICKSSTSYSLLTSSPLKKHSPASKTRYAATSQCSNNNGEHNQSTWMLQPSKNAGEKMEEKMVLEGHFFCKPEHPGVVLVILIQYQLYSNIKLNHVYSQTDMQFVGLRNCHS